MNVIFGGQIFPLCGVITSNGSFKKWGYNIKRAGNKTIWCFYSTPKLCR